MSVTEHQRTHRQAVSITAVALGAREIELTEINSENQLIR